MPLQEGAAPTVASAKILLDERVDLALLEAVAIGIEGELDGKHESEYEESQEDGLVELGAPDAGDYSCDHDKRADAGERAEKKDAGGATEISGRNNAKRDVGQHEGSVGKKDEEHASCGLHQVRAEQLGVSRERDHEQQADQGKAADDLSGENSTQHTLRVVNVFADQRASSRGRSATAQCSIQRSEEKK